MAGLDKEGARETNTKGKRTPGRYSLKSQGMEYFKEPIHRD